MKKNMVQNLINDLQELRGAEVRVFGQPTILEKNCNECTIDTIHILNSLKGNEAEMFILKYDEESEEEEEVEIDDIDQFLNFIEEVKGLEEINHLNSYNWCSPVSNHLDWITYKEAGSDTHYVKLMVHRFGDVRANYTDYVLLKFDNDYDFYELISENDIYLRDDEYEYCIRFTSDSVEVFSIDGNYVTTTYGDTLEELRENM